MDHSPVRPRSAGGSVIKPLVGVANDGPSDAAVVRPVLGLAARPRHRLRHESALRRSRSVTHGGQRHRRSGSQLRGRRRRSASNRDSDNFCWGNTDRPETLGSLVRAALACHDVAIALGTPFISGKDSLNNEFSYDVNGDRRTIAIPPSLLISAIGQVDDVRQCVTMDLKEPGNLLYQVGLTFNELGGSHFALVHELDGGDPPQLIRCEPRPRLPLCIARSKPAACEPVTI